MKKAMVWIVLFAFNLNAQTTKDTTNINRPRFGFSALLEFDQVNFYSEINSEEISQFTSDVSSLRFGGYYQTQKIFSEINFGIGGFSTMVKYQLPKNLFVSFDLKYNGFDETSGNYSYYSANELRIRQYIAGFGKNIPLRGEKKLAFRLLAGRISSNQFEAFSNNYQSNKVYKVSRKSILAPTLYYGAGVRFNFVKSHNFLIKKPVRYYVSASYMINSKSNFHREVSIEEWIPNNVVFKETTKDLNYLLEAYAFRFGMQW